MPVFKNEILFKKESPHFQPDFTTCYTEHGESSAAVVQDTVSVWGL